MSLSGFNELFLTQGRKQFITSEVPMNIGAENERKDKPLSSWKQLSITMQSPPLAPSFDKLRMTNVMVSLSGILLN